MGHPIYNFCHPADLTKLRATLDNDNRCLPIKDFKLAFVTLDVIESVKLAKEASKKNFQNESRNDDDHHQEGEGGGR